MCQYQGGVVSMLDSHSCSSWNILLACIGYFLWRLRVSDCPVAFDDTETPRIFIRHTVVGSFFALQMIHLGRS